MRSFIILLLSIAFISIAIPGQAEELKLGSVAGRVMTDNGKPIQGAKLVLNVYSFQTESWHRMTTDTNVKGWYVFKDVPLGKVEMKVYHTSRGPGSRTFELLSDIRHIENFIL